jgi:hypothetical protein
VKRHPSSRSGDELGDPAHAPEALIVVIVTVQHHGCPPGERPPEGLDVDRVVM